MIPANKLTYNDAVKAVIVEAETWFKFPDRDSPENANYTNAGDMKICRLLPETATPFQSPCSVNSISRSSEMIAIRFV